MQRIQLVSGEVLSGTPGALDPALHWVGERGLVSAEWGASENDRQAKFYKLTPDGRKQLEAEHETWERFPGRSRARTPRCMSGKKA